MDSEHSPAPENSPPAAPQPGFRSGVVARMARMPVATLRIWEQRYHAVRPTTAPSGHRLYSTLDVERVLLLRQLTEQGHAIGAMAALDAAQLQQVAGVQGLAAAGKGDRAAWSTTALRVVVVGRALALRLQRPAVVRGLAHRWQVTAVFESLADAAQAVFSRAPNDAVDWLLWQAPGLPVGALPELEAARAAWGMPAVAALYRFTGAAARKTFAGSGVRVAREPADDDALGTWLSSLEEASMPRRGRAPVSELSAGGIEPRRFDDAALTAVAGLSTTIACECPRHVAELLMQLSNFEEYSADCVHRDPADAALHAYLQQVAGASRALFEEALERVAREEGLTLP